VQVLVDADNVEPSRLRVFLAVLAEAGESAELVVAGRPAALDRTSWPAGALVVAAAGWQRADHVLAEAYVPGPEPLVLVSGDGDFVQLATRHPGPVLVVSNQAGSAVRLRDVATVVDPAADGPDALRNWFSGVGGRGSAT
jgi:hypothetical protein